LKVLLDTCVAAATKLALEAVGHDVVWSGDWPADPGDDDILALAHSEGRVLLTLDKDFGELAVVHERAHAGIVRLVGFSSSQQGPMCVRVLALYGNELESGAILTVAPGRVRIRDHRR
jgi:predicted nuclease of predicted toxin-antitoxin system